jgi:hypothetical protein
VEGHLGIQAIYSLGDFVEGHPGIQAIYSLGDFVEGHLGFKQYIPLVTVWKGILDSSNIFP